MIRPPKNATWRELVALGLCRTCRKPNITTSGPRCAKCLGVERLRYRTRVQNGECVHCGKPATAGAFCFHDWVRNIGHIYGFNLKNGGLSMLKELWEEQRGCCAVTGKKLTPGFDASLDHIVPVSKGGPSIKDNLRWTTLRVNRAKMDMSHEEFVEMCRSVVHAHDSIKGERNKILERSN